MGLREPQDALSLSAQKSRLAEEIKKPPRNYTVNRPRREHRFPSPSRIPTNQSRRILQNYRVHHRRRYFNLPLRRYVPQIYRRASLATIRAPFSLALRR